MMVGGGGKISIMPRGRRRAGRPNTGVPVAMSNDFRSAPLLEAELPIEVLQWGDGRFELASRFEERHLNLAGLAHGGFVATLLDMALAGGSYADRETPTDWYGITVSMTVNFVRGTGAGRVTCEGRPVGGGARTRHVEARLRDAEGTIASATGVIKVIERPKPGAG